jgi:hypothetical protein
LRHFDYRIASRRGAAVFIQPIQEQRPRNRRLGIRYEAPNAQVVVLAELSEKSGLSNTGIAEHDNSGRAGEFREVDEPGPFPSRPVIAYAKSARDQLVHRLDLAHWNIDSGPIIARCG